MNENLKERIDQSINEWNDKNKDII